MQVKVSETTPIQTDYLVAKALWGEVEVAKFGPLFRKGYMAPCIKGRARLFQPTTDWSQGGQIIERERIETRHDGRKSWCAWHRDYGAIHGPTLLIAAMRCFIASKLGDTVEVPEELV